MLCDSSKKKAAGSESEDYSDGAASLSDSQSRAEFATRRGGRRRRRSSKGKPGQARQAEEHRRAFRRTIKWRNGSEGGISTLKRGYGWDRTRIDGTEGARIWTGHGVLTHNLVKISALAA